MILSFILATVAGTPTAAHAAGPSFACAGASTQVERMICADPALAARDRALAVAYRHSRNARNALPVSPQAQWLAERNACRTPDCIGAAYDRRFEELMGEVPILPVRFERRGQPGMLAMVDLGDGWYLFELSALYIYPRHDNVSTGGAAGVVRIDHGRGRWRRPQPDIGEDCNLDFTRSPGGWSVRQTSFCGNGIGVELDGLYRPPLRRHARRR